MKIGRKRRRPINGQSLHIIALPYPADLHISYTSIVAGSSPSLHLLLTQSQPHLSPTLSSFVPLLLPQLLVNGNRQTFLFLWFLSLSTSLLSPSTPQLAMPIDLLHLWLPFPHQQPLPAQGPSNPIGQSEPRRLAFTCTQEAAQCRLFEPCMVDEGTPGPHIQQDGLEKCDTIEHCVVIVQGLQQKICN